MNPLKNGPQIKLPEAKVPGFVADLYHDLRERRLLPLVALLLVGIVAAPILLGGSSEETEPTTATPDRASAPTSSLVVTAAAPGLRDYKHRLGHLSPSDPFKQQYRSSESGSTSTEVEVESSTTTETSGSESEVSTPSSNSGSSGGTTPAGNPDAKPEITYFTFAIDVRVVPVAVEGKPSKAEASVRHDLPPLTMLPSRDTPALTYMGASRDGKKALMLVSSDVTSLFGDSRCIVGSETCQLLALEEGIPETIVYGPRARTYRIEVRKIKIEATDHLNKAPLGDPQHGAS